MRQRTSRRRIGGIALGVVLAIILGLTGWYLHDRGDTSPGDRQHNQQPAPAINKAIGQDVTVTGTKVPRNARASVAKQATQPSVKLVSPLSPIFEIGPSGNLAAPMTISLPLNRKVGKNEVVVIAVNHAHTADGWQYQTGTVSGDGTRVSFVVNRLSWFQALLSDLQAMFSELQQQFLDGMTGGVFAQAQKPSCQNEAQARTEDYRIASDSKDTIYWCFGVEKNERIVKIVNKRKYPLEIKTSALTQRSSDVSRLELAELTRLGGRTILFPGDSMTYMVNLKQGHKATINTDLSKFALGIRSAEAVIKSIMTLTTKLNLQSSAKPDELLSEVMKLKDCVGVLGTMNIGDLVAACFDKAFLAKYFSPQAAFLAPAMAVFSLGGVAQSMWQAYDDSKSGKAKYNVTVSRIKEDPFAAYVGTWSQNGRGVRDQLLIIGSNGAGSYTQVDWSCVDNGSSPEGCTRKYNVQLSHTPEGVVGAFTGTDVEDLPPMPLAKNGANMVLIGVGSAPPDYLRWSCREGTNVAVRCTYAHS